GGNALLVPNRCELLVDLRILPGQDLEVAKRELTQLLESERVNLEFVDVDPPFELRGDEQIVGILKRACRRALGREPGVSGIKSWTDAGHLVSRGIPSVVFGPGKLAVAHTPWEHVELDEVVGAVKVLYQIIEDVSK
ncbi:MAG: M20/M25/M40 family metallo-hydrolase, partial [Thermodesulfobacteriota bacterium]